MGKRNLLQTLHKLTCLKIYSPFISTVGQDAIYLAFTEPKPLFQESEKAQALKLIKTALPLLERSFHSLNVSLNPDLRQNAQRCRSGLQFLIDTFKDDTETYEELKPILSCCSVQQVEDYIRRTKDIEPEYINLGPQDLTLIPHSHIWWYEDDNDDDDDIDINNNIE